jgi:probable rRNA maturation factor
VNYIFCSDHYLLQINKQFLQHDYFTDIITFDLSVTDVIEAEIYISVDRVRDNASTLKVSFEDEILRVIIHGALHLCGYKDKKKSEIEKMRNREGHYMRLYKQSFDNNEHL